MLVLTDQARAELVELAQHESSLKLDLDEANKQLRKYEDLILDRDRKLKALEVLPSQLSAAKHTNEELQVCSSHFSSFALKLK